MAARVLTADSSQHSRGLTGTPAYIAGFVAGALLWLIIAATGLAVLATTFAALFIAVRYAGVAYLLYLAWKLWTTPVRPMGVPDTESDGSGRLFLTGLFINLGNPKVIVFFLPLLPTVVDLGALSPFGFAALALAVARARRVFTSLRSTRLINRGSSVIMARTAVSISTR